MNKQENKQENPTKKIGEFVFDGMLFVVVSWNGKPAAYIPECCGVVELSGWGLSVKRRIMRIWDNQ